MKFFRKHRIRKAVQARRAAAALIADAESRGDTRALSIARAKMREATHALMRAEGFGNG